MKRIIAFFVGCFFACFSVKADATAFLTEEEMPTGAKFLPLPPKPTDAAFYNDWRR